MNNAVMVTSLPRTGTTSISLMLERLGYEVYHAPLHKLEGLYGAGRAFSDTPCFAPSIMDWAVESGIPTKFIYIDRDYENWFYSMVRSTSLLRTNYRFQNTPDSDLSPGELVDKKYYGEVFGNYFVNDQNLINIIKTRFLKHREIATSEKYSPLIYNFDQGWEPLCDFLKLNIPEDITIPHLHNKSIGKKK